MNFYDSRKDIINPESFAEIISPLIVNRLIKKDFYLEISLYETRNYLTGALLMREYRSKNFHSGSSYDRAKEDKLD